MYQQYQQNTAQWTPVMTNTGISSAMLPPVNNQQTPHNLYIPTIQQQWQAQTNSYRQENPTNQNSQRMESTSEEEDDILCNDNDNNAWQVVEEQKEGKQEDYNKSPMTILLR
jgi:hypothetical protein